VQRGYRPEQSTATVFSIMKLAPSGDLTSRTAEGILNSLVKNVRGHGVFGDPWLGENHNVMFVFGTEHHRYFIEEGWSKERMQAWLWPRLFEDTKDVNDRKVNVAKPEGILLVAAGGPGMGETWMFLPHLAHAITRPIERA
jgi:hypothetical protein